MKPHYLLGLIAVACAACSSPRTARPYSDPAAARLDAEQTKQVSALGASVQEAASLISAPPPPPGAPRGALMASLKLIWTGTLQVEVVDFRKAAVDVAKTAAAFGGYVSDRQSSEDAGSHNRGTITLRIPSDRFDGAVSALKALGRVKNEGVKTQDVTKEYADLETRLKVKRETATRLREILIRQTGKVSEVLEVEREIARVLEEIEQAEGEKRYYDNLVSLSTITLNLYEPDSIVAPGAWDPLFAALRQSMHTMSESIAALVLLIAAALPWLIVILLVLRVARWRWARRKSSAMARAASPQQ